MMSAQADDKGIFLKPPKSRPKGVLEELTEGFKKGREVAGKKSEEKARKKAQRPERKSL